MTETDLSHRRYWALLKGREIIVIVVIVIIGVAMYIPTWLRNREASWARNATSNLYVFTQAQKDYQLNDLDGNGVRDYWTRDIRGFRRPDGSLLVSKELAAADGAFPDCQSQGGWLFAQMTGIRDGAKLDLGDGRGPDFAIHAYFESARPGDKGFRRTFAMTSLCWVLFGVPGNGTRVSEIPHNPQAEAWSTVD